MGTTLAAASLIGCGGKANRLRAERSALLDQRQAIQKGELPPGAPAKSSSKNQTPIDPDLPPQQRIQELDKRVAELDAELMQFK